MNTRACYNCKFSGQAFKIGKMTHYHCENEKKYPKEDIESGKYTAWDTLREFSNTCSEHEFKTKKQ